MRARVSAARCGAPIGGRVSYRRWPQGACTNTRNTQLTGPEIEVASPTQQQSTDTATTFRRRAVLSAGVTNAATVHGHRHLSTHGGVGLHSSCRQRRNSSRTQQLPDTGETPTACRRQPTNSPRAENQIAGRWSPTTRRILRGSRYSNCDVPELPGVRKYSR